jgi:hypothetical protein
MGIPNDNVVHPYGADAEKPQANNRREKKSDPVCAEVLQGEQAYQDHTCYWKQNICKSTESTFQRHNRMVTIHAAIRPEPAGTTSSSSNSERNVSNK